MYFKYANTRNIKYFVKKLHTISSVQQNTNDKILRSNLIRILNDTF